ncbi:hypothetical protein JCM8547_009175 [Rhodosporidiobolus lusitaniae]
MPLSSFLPSPWTLLKLAGGSLLLIVGGGGTALYLLQTRLIYPANLPSGSRENVPHPDEFGITPFEEVDLTAPDGVRIKAFLMPYQAAGVKMEDRPTVLLLHANAGNVGHRLPIAKVFWEKMRCNVLALSYRGYGHSEGSPTEKGLKLDSQTALDFLLSHPRLDKTPIFPYGQSIGGAVAIHLASQNATRLKGLIIENTFLSLPDLIPHIMPYLTPFLPYLLHQIWPSKDAIAKLPEDFPVLFLAGQRDELVEPGQMKGLFERCRSRRKEWKSFEYGTHNDTCIQPHYFAHIARFITSVCNLPLPFAFASSFPSSTSPPAKPAAIPASPTPSGPSSSDPVIVPPSPSRSRTSSDEDAKSSGGESFELVEAEAEETEGAKLENKEEISAGSMGLKEETEEVRREVKERVKAEL